MHDNVGTYTLSLSHTHPLSHPLSHTHRLSHTHPLSSTHTLTHPHTHAHQVPIKAGSQTVSADIWITITGSSLLSDTVCRGLNAKPRTPRFTHLVITVNVEAGDLLAVFLVSFRAYGSSLTQQESQESKITFLYMVGRRREFPP